MKESSLAIPNETPRVMDIGTKLACFDAVGQELWQVWNQTEPCCLFKPWLLEEYQNPSLTLRNAIGDNDVCLWHRLVGGHSNTVGMWYDFREQTIYNFLTHC